QHVREVPLARLVGPNVFRGEDGVESDAEPGVADREALVVDVRENDQLVVLLKVGERLGRIRRRWPVAYRAAIGMAFAATCGGTECVGEALAADGEELAVAHRRGLQLLRPLILSMELEHVLARRLARGAAPERLQRGVHAALPVDERAVAIEGEC